MPARPLRARATFWWGSRVVSQGDIVNSDDPVAQGDRAKLFDVVTLPPIVEQATAAPGERRSVRIPDKET